MCGRFTLTVTKEDLIKALKEDFTLDFSLPYEKRYNIAPTEDILAIIFDGTKYRVGYLQWGFSPFLNKSRKIINIRSESILEKKLFKELIFTNKILIPADGFYEWDKNTKIPYRFIQNNKLFYFAGLWSKYKTEDNKTIYTGAIITQKANNFIYETHDRMPVTIRDSEIKLWLKEKNPNIIKGFLEDNDKIFTKYQVSKSINSAINKEPNLIQPVI